MKDWAFRLLLGLGGLGWSVGNRVGSDCCGECEDAGWEGARLVQAISSYQPKQLLADLEGCDVCERYVYVLLGGPLHLQCLACLHPAKDHSLPKDGKDKRFWEFQRFPVRHSPSPSRLPWRGAELHKEAVGLEDYGRYTCAFAGRRASRIVKVCRPLPEIRLQCTSFLLPGADDIIGLQCGLRLASADVKARDFRSADQEWCDFRFVADAVRISSANISEPIVLDKSLKLSGQGFQQHSRACFPDCDSEVMCRGRDHEECKVLIDFPLRTHFQVSAAMVSKAQLDPLPLPPIVVSVRNNYRPRIRPRLLGPVGPRSAAFLLPAPSFSLFDQSCEDTVLSHRLKGNITRWGSRHTSQLSASIRRYETGDSGAGYQARTQSANSNCRVVVTVDGLIPHQAYSLHLSYGVSQSPYLSQSFHYLLKTGSVAPSELSPALVPGGLLQLGLSACRLFWRDVREEQTFGANFRLNVTHELGPPSQPSSSETLVRRNSSLSYADFDCGWGLGGRRQGRLRLSCANEMGPCGGTDSLDLGNALGQRTVALALARRLGEGGTGGRRRVEVRWSADLPEGSRRPESVSLLWCEASSWASCTRGVRQISVEGGLASAAVVEVERDCGLVFGVALCDGVSGCGMMTQAVWTDGDGPLPPVRDFTVKREGAAVVLRWRPPPVSRWPAIFAGAQLSRPGSQPTTIFISRDQMSNLSDGDHDVFMSAEIPFSEFSAGVSDLSVRAVYWPSMNLSAAATQTFADPSMVVKWSLAAWVGLGLGVGFPTLLLICLLVFALLYTQSRRFKRRVDERYWESKIKVPKLAWGRDKDVFVDANEDVETAAKGHFGKVPKGWLRQKSFGQTTKIPVAVKWVPMSLGAGDRDRIFKRFYQELVNHSVVGREGRGRRGLFRQGRPDEDAGFVVTCHGYCVVPSALTGFHDPGTFSPFSKDYMLILSWADGGDLERFLHERRNTLSRLDMTLIAHHMCQAIDFIHRERNHLHMDLKPDNFVVSLSGEGQPRAVRLCDFGHSRKCVGEGRLGRVGKGKGKGGQRCADYACRCEQGHQSYRAPELLLKRRASKAADVWALGLSVWEALTYASVRAVVPSEGLVTLWRQQMEDALGWSTQQRLTALARSTPLQISRARELYRQIRQCWTLCPEGRVSAQSLAFQVGRLYEELGKEGGGDVYRFAPQHLQPFDETDDLLHQARPRRPAHFGPAQPRPSPPVRLSLAAESGTESELDVESESSCSEDETQPCLGTAAGGSGSYAHQVVLPVVTGRGASPPPAYSPKPDPPPAPTPALGAPPAQPRVHLPNHTPASAQPPRPPPNNPNRPVPSNMSDGYADYSMSS